MDAVFAPAMPPIEPLLMYVRIYTRSCKYIYIYTYIHTRTYTRARELVAHILLCVTLTPLPIFVLGCRFRVFTRTKYL